MPYIYSSLYIRFNYFLYFFLKIKNKFSSMSKYIILFFYLNKYLNFLYFKSAAYIIKNKQHLDKNGIGLEKILQLKNRM